jgi:hypothetical protein
MKAIKLKEVRLAVRRRSDSVARIQDDESNNLRTTRDVATNLLSEISKCPGGAQ